MYLNVGRSWNNSTVFFINRVGVKYSYSYTGPGHDVKKAAGHISKWLAGTS